MTDHIPSSCLDGNFCDKSAEIKRSSESARKREHPFHAWACALGSALVRLQAVFEKLLISADSSKKLPSSVVVHHTEEPRIPMCSAGLLPEDHSGQGTVEAGSGLFSVLLQPSLHEVKT